jgi:hypothetical protein
VPCHALLEKRRVLRKKGSQLLKKAMGLLSSTYLQPSGVLLSFSDLQEPSNVFRTENPIKNHYG